MFSSLAYLYSRVSTFLLGESRQLRVRLSIRVAQCRSATTRHQRKKETQCDPSITTSTHTYVRAHFSPKNDESSPETLLRTAGDASRNSSALAVAESALSPYFSSKSAMPRRPGNRQKQRRPTILRRRIASKGTHRRGSLGLGGRSEERRVGKECRN